VFASGAMGNAAILPSSGEIYAPFASTVVTTFPTGHAFGVKSADGLEMLIHIGIDAANSRARGSPVR